MRTFILENTNGRPASMFEILISSISKTEVVFFFFVFFKARFKKNPSISIQLFYEEIIEAFI